MKSAETLARAFYAALPPAYPPESGVRTFPTSWEEQDERWRTSLVVGFQSLLDQGTITRPEDEGSLIARYVRLSAAGHPTSAQHALWAVARRVEAGCHRVGQRLGRLLEAR